MNLKIDFKSHRSKYQIFNHLTFFPNAPFWAPPSPWKRHKTSAFLFSGGSKEKIGKKRVKLKFSLTYLHVTNFKYLHPILDTAEANVSLNLYNTISKSWNIAATLPSYIWKLLTHSFPMHPFSNPWKHGFLMFSGGRKKAHRERLG